MQQQSPWNICFACKLSNCSTEKKYSIVTLLSWGSVNAIKPLSIFNCKVKLVPQVFKRFIWRQIQAVKTGVGWRWIEETQEKQLYYMPGWTEEKSQQNTSCSGIFTKYELSAVCQGCPSTQW